MSLCFVLQNTFFERFLCNSRIEVNKKTILTDVLKPTYVLAIKNELLICPIFGWIGLINF